MIQKTEAALATSVFFEGMVSFICYTGQALNFPDSVFAVRIGLILFEQRYTSFHKIGQCFSLEHIVCQQGQVDQLSNLLVFRCIC